MLFQSSSALGVSLASASACMPMTPQTSTSQAEANEILAHHAHHGARHDAEVLFHRRPALDGGDGAVGLLHPAFDHRAQLGHLQQRGFGDVVGGDVLLDGGQLGLHSVVRVLQAIDAAEDFRQIERLDRDAGALQQLLASSERC